MPVNYTHLTVLSYFVVSDQGRPMGVDDALCASSESDFSEELNVPNIRLKDGRPISGLHE